MPMANRMRALLLPFSTKGPPSIDPIIAPMIISEDSEELNTSLSNTKFSIAY